MIINEFRDNRGSLIIYPCEGYDQVNISVNTHKYTFRGMHYQENPRQKKIIKVLQGRILDFLYNLDTKTLGIYNLDDDENGYGLTVDTNFAHGFITLEPNTIVSYLVEGEYNPKEEKSMSWDSIPDLKYFMEEELKVNASDLIISDKDKLGK